MKTAVLIHGHHRDAAAWEETVWGASQSNRLGRVPKGILAAIEQDASLIIFGSGLHYEDGTIESRFIFDYMLGRLGELAAAAGKNAEELRQWIAARSYFDERSDKTENEMRFALQVAHERGIERFCFVSSPWHIMRCTKIAIIESEANPEFSTLRRNLHPVISDTNTPDLAASGVAIFEPPHRPDRQGVPFNTTLKDIVPFMSTQKPDIARGFNDALRSLIAEWSQKL